jgi:hypothetical protein
MKQSQTEWILERLQEGRTVTAIDALNGCGCFRLAARIKDLRDAGHHIVTTDYELPNGKHVAKYHLIQQVSQERQKEAA